LRRLVAVALLLGGCTVNGPPIVSAQTGHVTISQDRIAARGTLDAGFQMDQCTRRSIGPCNLVDCSARDGGMIMPVGAGLVSVSGLTGVTASVRPAADGTYPSTHLSGLLWNTKTTLSVFSGGSTVPRFTESLTTPVKDLVMLSPFGGPLAIDSSSDYNVSWGTPIDDDQVQLVLEMDVGATLTCTWAGSDLQDSIPTLAFVLLPRGDLGTGFWHADSVQNKQVTDGDWVLSLQAAQAGHDTRGISTSGSLKLQ